MAYSQRVRRFRGSRKRLRRLRWSARDRWGAVLLMLLCLLAAVAGGWLGANLSE